MLAIYTVRSVHKKKCYKYLFAEQVNVKLYRQNKALKWRRRSQSDTELYKVNGIASIVHMVLYSTLCNLLAAL